MIDSRLAGDSPKPYRGTQSVLRAIAILKCFDDNNQDLSLTELARELDLNKTTVFRLLSALESEGLIARKDSSDRFVLGPEIVTLAGYALRGIDLRTAARQTLLNLAEQTGETASLEVLSGDEMMIVDEVVGEHLVSGVRSLGTRWPMHGTSTGLAILAAWPEQQRELHFRDKTLEPVTAATITDRGKLQHLLFHIAEQGFAVSDEMLEPGLVAVGAPLVNFDGQVQAAISIYGPKSRLSEERVQRIGHLVCEAAASLSANLGYRP